MAHLTDMEELLSSIISENIRNYMREAMSCYMGGAYRGCIVFCYIALFDDLLIKLEELGKVNKKAKIIFTAADTKKTDQKVYESYLIDQLSSNKLIPELDANFLNILKLLRNKSAHPSGHTPSSEEARFIFSEVIQRFLSKPILSTTQLVDGIINKLNEKHLFPTTSITDIKNVVKEEIAPLHEQALPQLIIKLTASYTDDDDTIKKNASFFLAGLSEINTQNINKLLQKHLISPKSSDADFEVLIIRVISANGILYTGLSSTVCKRLKNIIANRIKTVRSTILPTKHSHPVSFFTSLIRNTEEAVVIEIFEDEFKDVIKNYFSTPSLMSCIKGKRKLKRIYLKVINELAGSSTYKYANDFSQTLPDIDNDLSKLITDRESLKILLHVICAASYNAFDAINLRRAKFDPTPALKQKATSYCA